ncbi:MAG: excinuclease ABC subunit UvrA [Planctomycetota bacterium]|nr:excinuclease ABC subunit UvrA [Planctomycetota bacterium]
MKGATMHNLMNIDVRIPKDKLTVITGVSGSGKTSLALDTIFAEGQRRFVESMSTYARRFLGRLDRAPVRSIEGLSPSIAIDQQNASRNPRSTVATNTEIYDYLRLLFSRVGVAHCPDCDRKLEAWTPTALTDRLIGRHGGRDALLLAPLFLPGWPAPLALKRPSDLGRVAGSLVREGYLRVLRGDEVRRLDENGAASGEKKGRAEPIYLVIDRLALRPGNRKRIAEGLEAALARGGGLVACKIEGESPEVYASLPACVSCGYIQEEELQPRGFSFNSHHGACEECTGLGEVRTLDVNLLIAHPELPLLEGALGERPGFLISKRSGYYRSVILSLAESHEIDLELPYRDLPARAKRILLNGVRGKVQVHMRRRRRRGRKYKFETEWKGLRSLIRDWHSRSDGGWWTERLERVMTVQRCPSCDGGRLKPGSLAVRIGGVNIAHVCALTVGEAASFFTDLELDTRGKTIASQVLRELSGRLSFLMDVGLSYLALDRGGATLSGGEAQRIRLASQIGSRLAGVLYVLDEPTVGLHQRDNRRLLDTLQNLKSLGNTVLVVEHDEQTIREADHVLDLGPGAGLRGGRVIASGPPSKLARSRSLTGRYLSGALSIPVPESRRRGNGRALWVRGARQHNLKGIDVRIPLGTLTALTGVSGSGKSTLLLDCLYPALLSATSDAGLSRPPAIKRLEGAEALTKVVVVDQAPIGRSPKSNPATYTKVLDPIRDAFAKTRQARMKGYGKARFSFNHWSGQCSACDGKGSIRIEMHFLSDVWIECDVCDGKRYNEETLRILYKGRSIADVLHMEVSEALGFFENHPRIVRILTTLEEVGLGYMHLGQAATTLSGGEAQRIKLASELSTRTDGTAIYLLDEPTTGLHFEDVRRLVEVLQRLVDRGHTVVVIEHNLDVIKSADHVIDLGPEGGEDGGRIVAQGPPEKIAASKRSHTGKYLSAALGN